MIEIKNLVFQYGNHARVFNGFNWHIGENETWSVLGSSGSGKSTLACQVYNKLNFAIVTKSLWIFQSYNFQCIDKVY